MALLITAIIVFALDRISKSYVAHHYAIGVLHPLLPPVLYLTYIRNAGAAFGILQHQRILFVVVAIAVSLAIAWYGRRSSPGLQIALGLVLGGAIGNLYGRVLSGTVIDFFNLRFWPVFNIADSAVVIGIVILVLRSLRGEKKHGHSHSRRH